MMKLFALLIVFCSVLCSAEVFSEERLVVVVHQSNPVEVMTRSEVIDLFMGKYVAFPTGVKAIAVDFGDEHLTRKTFYKQLVGKSLASVNAYWSRIRFSGKRKPPIQKEDYDQVVDYISTTETSIGYIPQSMVTRNMKVVFEFDK
jgi:ABC-type phosphate transport system substrate-binding protein